MDTISVIIPVYNRAFSVRDAIESVIIQTMKPSEIIVIDDGSSFDMSLYLKDYISHIKLITLKENKGVSTARNIGINKACGDYIALLDSDDIFLPNKLEYQINYMKENNFLISHTDEYWYRKDKWVNQGKVNKRYGGYIFDKILDKCRISPSSLIVHKSVFNKVGIFDEKLRVCEDYEISLRFALKYKIGYLEKKMIIKRAIEDNSLSANIKHIEYIRYGILERFYKNYFDTFNVNQEKVVKDEIERKKDIIKPFI